MELIFTGDGSLGAFSEQYDESYSSSVGARIEKLSKHVLPALMAIMPLYLQTHRVQNFAKSQNLQNQIASQNRQEILASQNRQNFSLAQNPQDAPTIRILDICFGLGWSAFLSAQVFVDMIRLFTPRFYSTSFFCPALSALHLQIISLEKDKHTLALAGKIHNLDSSLLARLERGDEVNIAPNVGLQIIWGDARENLARLEKEVKSALESAPDSTRQNPLFDIVYQDPFSPSKNAELWGLAHFKQLYNLCKTQAIITTYSTNAKQMQEACEAGFGAYRFAPSFENLAQTYRASFGAELADSSAQDSNALKNIINENMPKIRASSILTKGDLKLENFAGLKIRQ